MTAIAKQAGWTILLRDGSTVRARPYGVADADRVRAFLRALSPEALHYRFFGMIAIDHFDCSGLDASDPGERFTLLAQAGGRVLALATYVRRDEPAHDAEVAFVVADRLQGRGIATALLERLAQVARAHGFMAFTAVVLQDNVRMLDVFRHSGLPCQVTVDRDWCRVQLDLWPAGVGERLHVPAGVVD